MWKGGEDSIWQTNIVRYSYVVLTHHNVVLGYQASATSHHLLTQDYA